MKKHFKLLMSLGLAACSMAAVGAGLASKAAPVEETKAGTDFSKTIRVYVDLNWGGINNTRGAVNDSWKDCETSTESYGNYVFEGTSDTNLSFVNFYFKQNSSYWHPYSGSRDWDTQYSKIKGTFVPGKMYKISGISYNYGYDNEEHKWFNYTVTDLGEIPQFYDVSFYKDDKTTLIETKSVMKGSTVSIADPSKDPSGRNAYVFAGWTDIGGNAISLENVQSNFNAYASFNAVPRTGRYIVGKFGGGNWDIEHAVYMDHDSEYSGTVELGFKDEFKIAYWNGSKFESYFGYSKVTPNAAAYYCFTQGSNSGEYDNIQCYAAGSYTFYFTDNTYDGSYKISVAIDGGKTAQQLAAKLMSWGATPEEGKCGDRFPECKTMYLGLSGDEQTTFQGFASESEEQFLNAYNRYVAWANALGEKPWEDGKVSSSSLVLNTLMGEESSNIMIIVVVSVVALSAVAGFVFYKKRKNA